jgi:hypothetical protein
MQESLGRYTVKLHKQWFDECSELSGKWKHAKLQWLQNLSQMSGDNNNIVKYEVWMFRENKGLSERQNEFEEIRWY